MSEPVLEHAFVFVDPTDAAAFADAFAEAKRVIAASPGFRWVELYHGVERPEVHLLLVAWDTVDDHMVRFRGSDGFTRWRELIGPYFTRDTDVEHFAVVAHRFTG